MLDTIVTESTARLRPAVERLLGKRPAAPVLLAKVEAAFAELDRFPAHTEQRARVIGHIIDGFMIFHACTMRSCGFQSMRTDCCDPFQVATERFEALAAARGLQLPKMEWDNRDTWTPAEWACRA